MYEKIIADLNKLKTIFDNNDIVSYQLLLIKIKQIIEDIENNLNENNKKKYSVFLRDLITNLKLNQTLTIYQLNNLFLPDMQDLNIDDIEIYTTIFNLFIEELEETDNFFSLKLKEIIYFLIEKINNFLNTTEIINNNNTNITNTEIINNNNDITNTEIINNNNDINMISIKNIQYLKEYIIRKNLKAYKCEICGLSSWQNNPLILYLHSKNGEYSNKNLNNLEFLCPNCYSQIGE